MNPLLPLDQVEAWIKLHEAPIGGSLVKFEGFCEPSEKLVAWFETPKYLIAVSAWDHATCLDIEALNITTGQREFGVWGECDGVAGMIDRLDTFLTWLRSA